MNPVIKARFGEYQQLLIENPAVERYFVIKFNITAIDGRMRVRAHLIDGGLLEFAEYIRLDSDGQIVTYTYSFHWQDAQNQLQKRWDNVTHHPELDFAPDHIHFNDESIVGNPALPTLSTILIEIEDALGL